MSCSNEKKPDFKRALKIANDVLISSFVVSSFPYSITKVIKEKTKIVCRSYSHAAMSVSYTHLKWNIVSDAVNAKQIASIKVDKDSIPTGIKFVGGTAIDGMKYSKSLNKLSTEGDAQKIYLASTSKVYTLNKDGKFVEKELSYLTDKTVYDGVIALNNFAGNAVGVVIAGSAVTESTTKYARCV